MTRKDFKKWLTICLVIVLTIFFLKVVNSQWKKIFSKELSVYDQAVNFSVAANVSRKIFPPMVRVNPVSEEVIDDWKEGPYWQHIPPLFVYIPLPFLWIDGQVSIEVVRLSYMSVILLSGIALILTMYFLDMSITAILAATISSLFLISNNFSLEIIKGYIFSFGVSDIVLLFSVVCSFFAISSYFLKTKEERRNFSVKKIILISLVATMPLLVKNVLGAIPIATFFALLIYDNKKINSKVIAAAISSFVLLLLYYGTFYLNSPQTFVQEIFVAFKHFQNYEAFGHPWNFFFTTYLPDRYLPHYFSSYCAFMIFSVAILISNRKKFGLKNFKIMSLSIIWFAANIAAVSAVTSKVPGSIYQTFLLSLFFISFVIIQFLSDLPITNYLIEKIKWIFRKNYPHIINSITIILIVFGAFYLTKTILRFKEIRLEPYKYRTASEKLFQFAEKVREDGADQNDIFIFHSALPSNYSDYSDYWFRYYTIFLTGAESKLMREIADFGLTKSLDKYRYVYIVTNGRIAKQMHDSNIGQLEMFGNFYVLKTMPSVIINKDLINVISKIK